LAQDETRKKSSEKIRSNRSDLPNIALPESIVTTTGLAV